MMNILAVDSVGKIIEVLLIKGEKTYTRTLEHEKNASEFLLVEIDRILSENDTNLGDLDYLALNIGPGSFTGIRIAMSLFKGFMVTTGIKCITINSFDKMIYGIVNSCDKTSYNISSEKCLVVLDSGTPDYYAMLKDKYVSTFMSVNIEDIKKLSNEYTIYSNVTLDSSIVHTVVSGDNCLAQTVLSCLNDNGRIKNEYELEPLYVKKAQSEREYKQKFLNNITFTNAVEGDLVGIENLEKENFSSPYTTEQILQDILSNRVIVAKNNGVLVGYLSYIVSDVTEILKICVNKESRNMGIGQSLINKLNFYQKDIFIEVNEHNPAKNFYAKIGFRVISERKKYYKDGSNALIMLKRFSQ